MKKLLFVLVFAFVGEILKNEKYNIDISKIPAGKYLLTIVNGKTYTTPQKLIVK